MRDNAVKRALQQGDVCLGTMVFEFASTGLARLLDLAGAQFALFDQEHNGWGEETIRMLVATTRATNVVPLVRVAGSSYSQLTRPLDVGAMGVVVPMVENEAQARAVVAATKYPPEGQRGVGILFRDDYMNGGLGPTLEARNRETLVAVQIETQAGVDAAQRIAAIDGIDCLWIGQNDLTTSLGAPGNTNDSRYLDAVEGIRQAARSHGKALGRLATSVSEAKALVSEGFQLIAYGSDISVYEKALRRGLAELKADVQEPSAAHQTWRTHS